MKITLEFLEKLGACEEGIKFFKEKFGEETDHKILRKKLIKIERYNWLYWGISKILTNNNCVKFAIYCAELVLHIYEEKYSDDNRPRNAIKAAKVYLKNPLKETAEAARAAYRAAWAARKAAYEAADAANRAAGTAAGAARMAAEAACEAACEAAGAAAGAARRAALAANMAACDAAEAAANMAACDAAEAAANMAACDAPNAIKTKIINYGLKLIEGQETTQ